MNREEFERTFSALYFSLAARGEELGLSFRGATPFYDDGYATIDFGEQLILKVSTVDLEAFREASNLEQQALLDGLISKAQESAVG